MASEPIHVNDNSNLGQILDEAAERPVRVERDGVVYLVSVDEKDTDNLWEGYDPEAVRAAVREATGAIPGDADEIVERLYEARRIGSRPITRP